MAIRRSYVFSGSPTELGAGLILQNGMDIKSYFLGNSPGPNSLPYLAEVSGGDRALMGSEPGDGRSGLSLPVEIAGGFGKRTRTVTSGAKTATVDDGVILCNTSGGNVTLALPSAASAIRLILHVVKIDDANSLIIDPSGAETIDGLSTATVTGNTRSFILYSDGSNWRTLGLYPRLTTLIDNVAPSATIAGTVTTIDTSASTNFTGRPCIVQVAFNARNTNATDEFMLADLFVRIDAGSNQRICQWNCNLADNHQSGAGSIIIQPTQGAHTIDFRGQRLSGAGNFALDANDFVRMTCVEL